MRVRQVRKIKAVKKLQAGMIFLMLLVACVVPAHAEKVVLETNTQNGYARLLFELSSPSVVKVRIDSGVLVAQFDRALDFDLQLIRKSLGQFVALARQDNNGRVLRLALKQDFRFHTSSADNRVAIDIIPNQYVGDPEDIKPEMTAEQIEARETMAEMAAKEIAQGPVEMHPLKVQVGRRENYTRISFIWSELVEYSAVLENSKIKLAFKQPADPDIVELRVDPPKYIVTTEKIVTDKSLSIEISVLPGVGLRHFRDDNGIVIDVLQPQSKPRGGDAEVILSTTETPVEVKQNSSVDPVPHEKESEKHSEVSTPASNETGSEDILQDPLVDTASVPSAQDSQNDSVPSIDMSMVDEPPSDEQKKNPAVVAEERDTNSPEDHKKPDDVGQVIEALPDTLDKPTDQHTPNVIKVNGYDQGDSLRLTFRWGHDIAAAFFRRGPYVWMVFEDTTTELDFSLIDREYRQFFHSIDSKISDGARVVRLGIADHLLVTSLFEEGAWVVTLGEKILKPTAPLELKTVINYRFEPVIHVPLKNYGSIHKLEDPEVGDELTVVTALAPTRGVIATQTFVEFTTLRSAHGLVMRSLSDNIVVRPLESGIEISHVRGLSLSDHDMNTAFDGRVPLGSESAPAYMDFDEWQLGPFARFTTLEQELRREIARASDLEDQNFSQLAWVKMARFYISHDMGHEALGVLHVVARHDEEAQTDPAFLALRGVANFITRRFQESLDDFNNSSLNQDADAALWRGAIHAEMGNYIKARREFSTGMLMLSRYTDRWRDYFNVMAAKAALAVYDIEKVEWYLEKLSGESTSSAIRAETDFIRGEIFEALGRTEEAVALYAHVIAVASEPVAAKASFVSTAALYQSGKIDVAQAIENLEKLRFQWRGGPLELMILQRLGEFYVDQGDYRHGLTIMRETIVSYPESSAARKISLSMGDIFKKLFLEESFDDMTPVRALAVYYEFRELTPIGRDGDDMIRKLANRLISVDLLEQAADLLDHQVRNRLQGVARAQVATRLAMVYLMDRKNENALQIIRNTRLAGIPESLVFSRRLLEARSLAELGRYSHALELIEQYHVTRAEQIRADIYWKSQDWPRAAAKIEDLLGDLWKKEEPLMEKERENIMRAAVSYSLAGDQNGLTRLRTKYGAKMIESEDASSFEIVTQSIDQQGTEFRLLASSIATTDTLDAFMADFREQFQMSDAALN